MVRAFAILLSLAASAAAIELTPDNFDDAVAGKVVFIKFQAPWWGHCKKMKPAWDSLMEQYASHETKLVGDCDCTAAGKPLCDANGVKGFPTIKYGDPTDLQAYEGGRDLKALQTFAETKLVPMCSPAKLDLCDDAKKADIEKFMALPAAELDTLIEAKDAEQTAADKEFDEAVKNLQKTYEGLQKTKEEKIEAIKESGLGLMKAVKAHNAKAGKKDEL